MLARDDPLAVDVEPGKRARVGPSREHHAPAALVAGPVDLDGVRRDELAGALDDRDVARLDQAGQALVKPRDDAVLVLVHAGHVDAVEAGLDADLLAVA